MIQIEKFKSGQFVRTITNYKAFSPSKINQTYSWIDPELTNLVDVATQKIGGINAWSEQVPNIDRFIKMYVLKEATDSSRIEGTQTTMQEAMLKIQDIPPERKDDWVEVQNYIESMNNSIEQLQKLPLSSRLMRNAHKILLSGARGENRQPGEYRTSQNWIGGSSINNAIFIPPIYQEVNELMGDLENFLHNKTTGLPNLMKIGLAHYQFETIHPFLDGNGRIGRLLITLYLVEQKILCKPVLYLSDFFDKNKNNYYDFLTEVRTKNDLMKWLKFFLTGIINTADNSIGVFKGIIKLKEDCESKIYQLGRKAPKAKIFLNYIFQQPSFDAEGCSMATGLSIVSAYSLIKDFQRLGILKELTGHKRNRIFYFHSLYSLFNTK
jgi:cell filamentation protein, protein adenylyltransferase